MSKSDDTEIRSYTREVTKSRFKDFDNLDMEIIKWRNEIIKFAVTGRCMGKSTFINLVHDVCHGDPEFTEVEFGDCTVAPSEY